MLLGEGSPPPLPVREIPERVCEMGRGETLAPGFHWHNPVVSLLHTPCQRLWYRPSHHPKSHTHTFLFHFITNFHALHTNNRGRHVPDLFPCYSRHVPSSLSLPLSPLFSFSLSSLPSLFIQFLWQNLLFYTVTLLHCVSPPLPGGHCVLLPFVPTKQSNWLIR